MEPASGFLYSVPQNEKASILEESDFAIAMVQVHHGHRMDCLANSTTPSGQWHGGPSNFRLIHFGDLNNNRGSLS